MNAPGRGLGCAPSIKRRRTAGTTKRRHDCALRLPPQRTIADFRRSATSRVDHGSAKARESRDRAAGTASPAAALPAAARGEQGATQEEKRRANEEPVPGAGVGDGNAVAAGGGEADRPAAGARRALDAAAGR